MSHRDAPVTLLLAHAIELYLKAFLRLRGLGIEEVKNSFGHDFKMLVNEAASRGLDLMDEDMNIAAILTEKESMESLGKRRPPPGARRPPVYVSCGSIDLGQNQKVVARVAFIRFDPDICVRDLNSDVRLGQKRDQAKDCAPENDIFYNKSLPLHRVAAVWVIEDWRS